MTRNRARKPSRPASVPAVSSHDVPAWSDVEHAASVVATSRATEAGGRRSEAAEALYDAVTQRSRAERVLSQAITDARRHGISWEVISAITGQSASTLRRRYGSQ